MKKRIMLYAVVLFLMTSCNSGSKKMNTRGNVLTDTISSDPIILPALERYSLFISYLDTFDMHTSTMAAQKFEEIFAKESTATKDSAFVIFNTYYEKLRKWLEWKDSERLHGAYIKATLNDAGVWEGLPPKWGKYNVNLENNGFRVENIMGDMYIGYNLDFIAKWFYPHVSPEMKAYLVQLNKENKEGFSSDGSIIIDPERFVDRMVWWEKFVTGYPDFFFSDEARKKKCYYFSILLGGDDCERVIGGNTLTKYYQDAYSYLQRRHQGTETAKLVKPYYHAILQQNIADANALLEEYKSKGYILPDTSLEWEI